MCGIVGHVAASGQDADVAAVEQACNLLRHRGPDGKGVANYDGASFGHRRLSIIDLELSVQPWISTDQRYTLVFNGEIYNYVELRAELEDRGRTFSSNGDTEVLLQMYLQYGVDCLHRLNGMFAFAIWDNVERTLFLARDRLGKKPLYYAEFARGMAFASEIDALTQIRGIDLTTDLDAAHNYFAYQFVPGSQSIHLGIRKLQPAHYLYFKNGESRTERYWSVHNGARLPPASERSAALRELVKDAVRIRLRSDVPLGLFLSGGLDSSIILHSMHDLGADIHSYTVGFKEKSYDESELSRRFAERFEVDHHEKVIDFDPSSAVLEVTKRLGEPFADPSAIPTWYLCQHASDSVTVALSGDGADELFGGYQRYRAMAYLRFYNMLPTVVRHRFIEPLAAQMRESSAYYGKNLPKKIKLFLRLAKRLELSPRDLLPQGFDIGERHEVFDSRLVNIGAADHVKQFGLEKCNPIDRMMLADINAYLSEDILTKVDRMSMAHSLEVRSPLLDYRIAEFACGLDTNSKIRGGETKFMLREAYRSDLPAELLKRSKHGFDVPLGAWFRKELKGMFQDAVLDAPCPDYLKRETIDRIWRLHQQERGDFGVKLWTILVYFLWQSRTSATVR